MKHALEFYFDVGSAASYLAWTQVPRIARETGCEVEYRPMLLGGVFQATGNRSPMEVPAKGQYMVDDLQRFAKRYGVPFAQNAHFPIHTLALMRMILGLQLREPERMVPFVDALYRAIWVEGRNMNDPATVSAVVQAAGFDPEKMLALSKDPAVKDDLKAATQEAVQRGVFGAPTFFVGQEMFWGQDRLDFVKEALQQ